VVAAAAAAFHVCDTRAQQLRRCFNPHAAARVPPCVPAAALLVLAPGCLYCCHCCWYCWHCCCLCMALCLLRPCSSLRCCWRSCSPGRCCSSSANHEEGCVNKSESDASQLSRTVPVQQLLCPGCYAYALRLIAQIPMHDHVLRSLSGG
jgi:hypothetical protein